MKTGLKIAGFMSLLCALIGCNSGTEGAQVGVTCGESELIAQCPENTTPNLTAAAISRCEQGGSLETGADPSASGEVSQACFGQGSCQVVCEFNDPCMYGVYTLSDSDGIVCNAPPGGAGDGECGNGENELNSPRDCGATCESGEILCENGNAQIRCNQMGFFMDALSCAPDEICRNGQGCVREDEDGPADMDMGAPDPVMDAGRPESSDTSAPMDVDMNVPTEVDMSVESMEMDMSVPVEDAASPPELDAAPSPEVDAAPPPEADAAPPAPPCNEHPLMRPECRVDIGSFVESIGRAFRGGEGRAVCPALGSQRDPEDTIVYFMTQIGSSIEEGLGADRQFQHTYAQHRFCSDRPVLESLLANFYPYLAQIDRWNEICFAEFDHRDFLGEEDRNVSNLCQRWSRSYIECRESDTGTCETCNPQAVPELRGWCQEAMADNNENAERRLSMLTLLKAGEVSLPIDNRSCRAYLDISHVVFRNADRVCE